MRLLAALAVSALALTSSSPAFAGWNHTPSGAPVCAANGDQHHPVTLADGNGGAFVVWTDLRNGNYDVFAQRINSAGNPLWALDGVPVCTAAGQQDRPKVISDGAGGVIVAWEDGRGANYDIYAQRLNADGVPQWTTDGVVVNNAAGDQFDPTIATDGLGGAIIAWIDYRAGSTSDIWCQRLNSAGVKQWFPNGNSIVNATGDQDSPAIVTDGQNGIWATWVDRRNASNYDLYYRRVAANGFPQGPINGLPMCTSIGDQLAPVIASDNAKGALVAWYDSRSGYYDVYAQRVNAAGTALWGANGDSVCAYLGDQQYPEIISDGADGAFVAWEDSRNFVDDLYAQHLDGLGQRTWAANGAPLCLAPGTQSEPHLLADGQGGMLAVWQDARSGAYDVYSQHLDATGTPIFGASGMAVCTAGDQQFYPSLVSDGRGGAIVAWEDDRNFVSDIWAQRVLPAGGLGSLEPVISAITDVPQDNGGVLNLSFAAGWNDGGVQPLLARYLIWRHGPGQPWALVDSLDATGAAGYSLLEPSVADSINGHPAPRTSFRVDGVDATGAVTWASLPDSGVSIDNIGPGMPQALLATIVDGQVHLTWQPVAAPDLAGYRIYAGTGSTFGLATPWFRAQVGTAAYVGPIAGTSSYKVTAIDVHGNESEPAFAQPEATLGVDGAAQVFFAPPSPNPSSRATTLRFGLTREARVDVGVYDERGRRVAVLANGRLTAGEHTLLWDGHDESGRDVAPGLYFVRAKLDGREYSRRIVRVR